jgi:hypothetical protein
VTSLDQIGRSAAWQSVKFFQTQSNDPFAAVGSVFLRPEEFDGRLHQGNLTRVFMKIADDEIADILI